MSEILGRIRGGVHASVRHDSAVGHVTGAARYLDDIPNVSGTLEAALVLSPHAHARIKHIDVARALAAPGVIAVIAESDPREAAKLESRDVLALHCCEYAP